MSVEISSHPQTVATASHYFAKPTASPSSRCRQRTVEHGRLGIRDIDFLYTEGIPIVLHTSSRPRSELLSLLLGD